MKTFHDFLEGRFGEEPTEELPKKPGQLYEEPWGYEFAGKVAEMIDFLQTQDRRLKGIVTVHFDKEVPGEWRRGKLSKLTWGYEFAGTVEEMIAFLSRRPSLTSGGISPHWEGIVDVEFNKKPVWRSAKREKNFW